MQLLLVLLSILMLTSLASAEDSIVDSSNIFKDQALRMGNEALEVVKTPLDVHGYGLLGTLGVAGAVGLTYVFDDDIRRDLLKNKSRGMDRATEAGTWVGDPFMHMGIALAVFGGGYLADSPRWKETGAMMAEAALLADATTFLLKEGIGRARPFVRGDKAGFRPGQFKNDYDSMPSMHTASSFAMASILSATSESLPASLFYYSVAGFVGFSRIYRDKHWASDVILGAAIGELCGQVVRKVHAEKEENSVSFIPYMSDSSAGMALTGRW